MVQKCLKFITVDELLQGMAKHFYIEILAVQTIVNVLMKGGELFDIIVRVKAIATK